MHAHSHSATKTAPGAAPAVPFCPACGTDEFLLIEDYVPARILPDGQNKPADVSYSCSKCGQFSGHEVPPTWTPPGWNWFA